MFPRLWMVLALCGGWAMPTLVELAWAESPDQGAETTSEAKPAMVADAIARLNAKETAVLQEAVWIVGGAGKSAEAAIEPLVGLLGHDDDQLRWSAAWALWQIGEKSCEPVARRLNDPDVRVRRTASYVLARLTPDSLLANRLLLPAAADQDRLVRRHAYWAIECLTPESRKLLTAECYALRAELLANFEPPDAQSTSLFRYKPLMQRLRTQLGPVETVELPNIISLLDHSSPATRIAACLTLAELGPKAHPATLKLGPLLADETLVAEAAFETLLAIGPGAKAAAPHLIGRIERLHANPVMSFRREILLLVQWQPDPASIVPLLLKMTEEYQSRTVRVNQLGHKEAMAALGQIAPEPPPVLLEMLASETAAARNVAAKALGGFGPKAAKYVPRLIEQLKDKDQFAALAALVALEQIGPTASEAIPVLAQMARKGNAGGTEFFLKHPTEIPYRGYEHPYLLHVLGKLGPKALPVLLEFLRDKSGAHSKDAAIGLGHLGKAARAAVPALIEATRDEDHGTSLAAIAALGAIGPDAKEAIPALIELLRQETRQDSIHILATALVHIDSHDERVVQTLHDERLSNEHFSFNATVRKVLFDAGLLTEEDFLKLAGRRSFPLDARDARWRKFVADHIPLLMRCLVGTQDRNVQDWAARALGYVDLEQHPEILDAWADRLDNETFRNLLIFGRISGEGTPRRIAIPHLIRQLSSPSEVNRTQAVELLGMYFSFSMNPKQRAVIQRFIANPPPHAVETAKQLDKKLDGFYVRALFKARPYPELIRLAAMKPNGEALRELATYGPAAVPTLQRFALGELSRPGQRWAALHALASLGNEALEARAALLQFSADATQLPGFRDGAGVTLKAIDDDRFSILPRRTDQ